MIEQLTSVDTFHITGRGTVKVMRLSDIKYEYRIGNAICIDGQVWTITGIDSPSLSGLFGIFVRAEKGK